MNLGDDKAIHRLGLITYFLSNPGRWQQLSQRDKALLLGYAAILGQVAQGVDVNPPAPCDCGCKDGQG